MTAGKRIAELEDEVAALRSAQRASSDIAPTPWWRRFFNGTRAR
jgi:hypothetical protein